MMQTWLAVKIFEFVLLQYIIPMLKYVLPSATTNFILLQTNKICYGWR